MESVFTPYLTQIDQMRINVDQAFYYYSYIGMYPLMIISIYKMFQKTPKEMPKKRSMIDNIVLLLTYFSQYYYYWDMALNGILFYHSNTSNCQKLLFSHHWFSIFIVPMIVNLKHQYWSMVMAPCIHAVLLVHEIHPLIEVLYTISMVTSVYVCITDGYPYKRYVSQKSFKFYAICLTIILLTMVQQECKNVYVEGNGFAFITK